MENYGYILCRYNSNNLLQTMIKSFLEIEYLTNEFDFINEEELKQSYLDFLSGNHIKNGHYMLFPKNYIFSFEYQNNLYELYAINKYSKYVLLTFNIETKLIGCVKDFSNYDNALTQMKINYCNTFDDDIINTSNTQIILHDGIVFGMIFRCYLLE